MTYDSISRAKMIKTGSNVIGNSALMENKHMSDFPGLFEKSKSLIDNARKGLGVIANTVTVYTSFLLGKYMVEEEQQGSDRAKYGEKVLDQLSEYLTNEYGRGFSRSNLAGMRKFYITYRDRESAIVQSGIGQLGAMQENGIVQSQIGQLTLDRDCLSRASKLTAKRKILNFSS